MVMLKGMTWEHVRGIAPVRAAAQAFSQTSPEVQIEWKARSLKDFEDFPVEVLAKEYDLLMIDHPFIGEAVAKGIFEPLDAWLPDEFLADQHRNSVGPSHASYNWQGRQWALAVDTAAQVAAWRPDLLSAPLPRSFDDVLELARDLPAGQKIGLPLVATHAYSSFMTLNANIGGGDFWQGYTQLREDVALEALDLLARLAAVADRRSLQMNPIHMLDAMASGSDIVYVPLIYGYSNYARDGYAPHVVHFGNMPSTVATPRGSQIGGVGLAVSAFSRHKREAMAFARHAASTECQSGLFYFSGGQPGHRKAWLDDAINDDCHGFFRNTLETLDLAWLRPRRPGYNRFQEAAGEVICHHLKAGGDARRLVRTINTLFQDIVLQA